MACRAFGARAFRSVSPFQGSFDFAPSALMRRIFCSPFQGSVFFRAFGAHAFRSVSPFQGSVFFRAFGARAFRSVSPFQGARSSVALSAQIHGTFCLPFHHSAFHVATAKPQKLRRDRLARSSVQRSESKSQ